MTGVDWGEVATRLGISGTQAIAVVLSAIGIYLAFLVLVRIFGPRVLQGMGTFDVLVTVALGSIAGRLILGHPPTLAAGVLGLVCLLTMEAIFGEARRRIRGATQVINVAPVVLMAASRVLPANLVRCHVTDRELWSVLRIAGVRNREEVACAIFESTGRISVLKRGELIDPALLDGVRDADQIPPELLGRPEDDAR